MWKLSKKYGVLVVCALVALGFGVAQFKHADSRENQLIIGLQSGYPPFEFRDREGKIVGFDVDVGSAIAEKLGKELVVKDMEFEGVVLSLKQGKIDLIMSGMNITPSRLKEIAMVPYHGDGAHALSLIFWGKVPPGVRGIADIAKLPGGSVSVESGSIPEAYLAKFPSVKAKSFQGALAPLMDVKFGKSTANLVEPDVAAYLKKEHPDLVVVEVPLAPDDEIAGFGIGIKKENQELIEKVSATIEELKVSGKLQGLEEKWFKGADCHLDDLGDSAKYSKYESSDAGEGFTLAKEILEVDGALQQVHREWLEAISVQGGGV